MRWLFVKWQNDARGVPQAIFSRGWRLIAFSRLELTATFPQLHTRKWLAEVEVALATE